MLLVVEYNTNVLSLKHRIFFTKAQDRDMHNPGTNSSFTHFLPTLNYSLKFGRMAIVNNTTPQDPPENHPFLLHHQLRKFRHRGEIISQQFPEDTVPLTVGILQMSRKI